MLTSSPPRRSDSERLRKGFMTKGELALKMATLSWAPGNAD